MKDMNKREKIIEVIRDEGLTVKEIATKLNFEEDYVRTSLNRLKKQNIVNTIGDRKKNKIYQSKPNKNDILIEILKKFIPAFRENNLDINFSDNEFNIIKEIYEEMKQENA